RRARRAVRHRRRLHAALRHRHLEHRRGAHHHRARGRPRPRGGDLRRGGHPLPSPCGTAALRLVHPTPPHHHLRSAPGPRPRRTTQAAAHPRPARPRAHPGRTADRRSAPLARRPGGDPAAGRARPRPHLKADPSSIVESLVAVAPAPEIGGDPHPPPEAPIDRPTTPSTAPDVAPPRVIGRRGALCSGLAATVTAASALTAAPASATSPGGRGPATEPADRSVVLVGANPGFRLLDGDDVTAYVS